VLPPAVQTELVSFNTEIIEEFKELERTVNIKEEIKLEETFKFQEPKLETFKEPTPMKVKQEFKEPTPMMKEEPGLTETAGPSGEGNNAPVQSAQKEEETFSPASAGTSTPQKETQESQILEPDDNKKNDSSTETTESNQSPDSTDKTDKASGDVKDSSKVSLAKTMEKIDTQVKDIGKNLQLKNLVKIKLMSDNSALESYSKVKFYEPKNIYLDQANIQDNRMLYNNVTLASYQQKDPVFQQQKKIFQIRQQKEKLIKELQLMKK
jgi:hypothetical protein